MITVTFLRLPNLVQGVNAVLACGVLVYNVIRLVQTIRTRRQRERNEL
ncbi:MAG: hypothetical protein ACYCYO_00155 [Bacilli bacterium]